MTQHVNETRGGHMETCPAAEKEWKVRHSRTFSEVQWCDSRGAGGCDEGRTRWHMQHVLVLDPQEGGWVVWMQHMWVVDPQQGDGVS